VTPVPIMVVVHQKNVVFEEKALARNLEPKCKQCRREGEKLFLKGKSVLTDKCAIERRSYPLDSMDRKKDVYLTTVDNFVKTRKLEKIYGNIRKQFRIYTSC